MNLFLVPAAVLLLPVFLTLYFRWAALHAPEAEQKTVWASYRGFSRFTLTIIVAAWWVIWDLAGRSGLVSIFLRRWPGVFEISSQENWRFWLPPAVSLGIFLILCYSVDKTVLRLRWDNRRHIAASLVETRELCHSIVDGRCWLRRHP
jgi:hypothetical protein